MDKRDLLIDKDFTVKEWIDNNINIYGAKEFYDTLNNCYDSEILDSIVQSILNEIYSKIKPDKIETIEDLAKLLDGNEYGDELDNEHNINVEELCKQNKWLVAFPYSDDNLELRGIIDDEIGAWDGTLVKFVKKGDFYLEDCDDYRDDDALYKKANSNMFATINETELNDIKKKTGNWADYDGVIIEALWDPENSDASWQLNCCGDVEAVKFNIMEDEELYAECLIIDMSSLIKD